MRNAGLEGAQAGIKIAGRNINNLSCTDDTTLMAESEEELKRLLMKVKEESEKVGLKLSSGHRTGKGHFSFQSQRKAMPKNAQTTAQLHSSHMLAKSCSKFSKPGFTNTWTVNFQMFKLVLEKAENQRSNCQHLLDHQKSKRVPEKHLFLLYWLCQSLRLCGSQYTVENSERDGNTRPPDLPLEKPICRSGSNS